MAKRFSFTVTGAGTFPFDMLRYDGAYPTDTESAYQMDTPYRPSTEKLRDFNLNKRSVNLMCTDREPTEARWNSFGWKVENIRRV